MTWHELSLARVIARIPVAVAVTRPDGRIEYANPSMQALLAEPEAKLLGRRFELFRTDGRIFVPLDGEPRQGESRLRTRTGDEIHVLETVYPVRDERGAVAHLIHFMQDVSAQKHAEHLAALAFHDSLTGLPNRKLFEDRLARTILAAERQCSGFALLYIDVDRFKAINDTWGHAAGDRVLCEVTRRMSRALRRSDTLARLGGDEFAAIVEGVRSHPAVSAVVDKLFGLCGEDYEVNGIAVRVTLSLGIGVYPEDGRDAATLLEHADRAMYHAKAQGRNCYCFVAAPYGLASNAG